MTTLSHLQLVKKVLGDSRYNEHHRFPKWNIKPTVLDEPRLFRQVFPEIDKAEHIRRAKKFMKKAVQLLNLWDQEVDKAILQHGQHGALISGVYRDHFPTETKDTLRVLAHGSSLARTASAAHEKAAKSFRKSRA